MHVSVQPDPEAAAVAAAEFIAASLRGAVATRGLGTVALSGGNTPRLMYRALRGHDLPWSLIHICQVDERAAPTDSDASNATHIYRALVEENLDLPSENWHPMPISMSRLDLAAETYSGLLTNEFNGTFDVVHLGLGDDGHTASWPPGDPVVESTKLVAPVEDFNGYSRLTLTPLAVNQARHIVWFVVGRSKKDVLSRWRKQDTRLPSSYARRTDSDALYTDEDAAG